MAQPSFNPNPNSISRHAHSHPFHHSSAPHLPFISTRQTGVLPAGSRTTDPGAAGARASLPQSFCSASRYTVNSSGAHTLLPLVLTVITDKYTRAIVELPTLNSVLSS
jgi:hypothetical protein